MHKLADARFDGKVIPEGRLKMEKPDLSKIPIMHHFPKDAGKYLTAGIVFSKWDGVENASIHRMLVIDDHRVAARLVEGRHTHVMLQKALAKGERLPDCRDNRDTPGGDLCELYPGSHG